MKISRFVSNITLGIAMYSSKGWLFRYVLLHHIISLLFFFKSDIHFWCVYLPTYDDMLRIVFFFVYRSRFPGQTAISL
jgi:hypothetical protein